MLDDFTGKLYLTEGQLGRDTMWCEAENHIYFYVEIF